MLFVLAIDIKNLYWVLKLYLPKMVFVTDFLSIFNVRK